MKNRDAFASLLSKQQTSARMNSKQSRLRGSPLASKKPAATAASGRRPGAPQEGSRFVQCPLCGKSVHSSLAQSHVEQCSTTSSAAAEATSTQPKHTTQQGGMPPLQHSPAALCGGTTPLQGASKRIVPPSTGGVEDSGDCAAVAATVSQSPAVCSATGAADRDTRLKVCANMASIHHAVGVDQNTTRNCSLSSSVVMLHYSYYPIDTYHSYDLT